MAEKKINLVELTVESDNHVHAGEPCKRGDKIKVSEAAAKALKASWDKQKKAEKK